MKKKEKELILTLFKYCSSFYSQDGKRWRLDVSINIENPEVVSVLRKFFTEDK